MSAKDRFHNAVKTALQKDGWVITDDPLRIRISSEDDIAAELVEMGVPKQDIVLGFHAPRMRQFTDFAVG